MQVPDWATDGVAIARTTVRRRLRRKRRHPRRFALELLVLGALWLVVVARYVDPGGAGGAVVGVPPAVQTTVLSNLDDALRSALGVDPAAFARALVAALWLLLVNVRAANVTSSVDDLDVAAVDLLSTSVRAVVLGDALAGNVRLLVRYGTHLVLGAALFALGGGSPAALPVTLGVLVVLQVSASLAGYVLGLGTWAWLLGSDRRWANRHLVGAPLRFAYPGFLLLLATGFVPVATAPLVAAGSAVPVGWTADVVLVALPGVGGDPLGGLLVLGALAAATVPLFDATQRLANRVWFADRVGGGPLDDTTDAVRGANRGVADRAVAALERLVVPLADRPTRTMVRRSWTLVLRNPGRVYLVAIPLVVGGFEVLDGAASGDAFGPLFVAAVSGVVVCLSVVPSPFALESPVFPALLTAGVSGRQVVRAYLLVTAGLVLPAALLGTGLAAAFSPAPPAVAAGSVALAAVLVPAGSALAVGAGVAMPNTSLAAGRPTVSLDRYAQAAAVAVVALAAAPALLALGLPLAFDQFAFGGHVQAGSVAASVLLAVAAGATAYRYAAREFETMTV
jgi:hypothetical protein